MDIGDIMEVEHWRQNGHCTLETEWTFDIGDKMDVGDIMDIGH